jgi:hypothetical protein
MKYVAFILLAIVLATPSSAQKKKGKKSKAKVSTVTYNVAEWELYVNDWWGYGVKAPKDWLMLRTHHDDPDGVPIAGSALNSQGNAIEFNRDAKDQKNTPYVLFYAIKKEFEEFEEFSRKFRPALEQFGGIIHESKQLLLNGMIGYEFTYEFPNMATVKSLVLYHEGRRFGLMFTVNDDPEGRAFAKNLPLFEEMLKSFHLTQAHGD